MIKQLTLYKERANFTNKLYKYKNGEYCINFTDGINVITGRNGSGKSVLLTILKKKCGIRSDSTYTSMPHAMEMSKGFFDNTYYTMPEFIENKYKNTEFPKSNIVWDGSIVHHLTPDFFTPDDMYKRYINNSYSTPKNELFSGIESLSMKITKYSKGEGCINLLTKLNNLSTEFDKPLQHVNDVWAKVSDIYQDWINSTPKDGKPTLLIDELDQNLDLDNQYAYWHYIESLTKKWQVIVVSHSMFAFKIKDVNHIKLNPDYFKNVNKL